MEDKADNFVISFIVDNDAIFVLIVKHFLNLISSFFFFLFKRLLSEPNKTDMFMLTTNVSLIESISFKVP